MANMPPLGKVPRRPASQYPRVLAEGMSGPRNYVDVIEISSESFVLGEYEGPPFVSYGFSGPYTREQVNAKVPRMVAVPDDVFDVGHPTWGLPPAMVSQRYKPLKAIMERLHLPVGPATPKIPAARSGSDLPDELAKLAELHSKGVLDDDEFAKAKRNLLEG